MPVVSMWIFSCVNSLYAGSKIEKAAKNSLKRIFVYEPVYTFKKSS